MDSHCLFVGRGDYDSVIVVRTVLYKVFFGLLFIFCGFKLFD